MNKMSDFTIALKPDQTLVRDAEAAIRALDTTALPKHIAINLYGIQSQLSLIGLALDTNADPSGLQAGLQRDLDKIEEQGPIDAIRDLWNKLEQVATPVEKAKTDPLDELKALLPQAPATPETPQNAALARLLAELSQQSLPSVTPSTEPLLAEKAAAQVAGSLDELHQMLRAIPAKEPENILTLDHITGTQEARSNSNVLNDRLSGIKLMVTAYHNELQENPVVESDDKKLAVESLNRTTLASFLSRLELDLDSAVRTGVTEDSVNSIYDHIGAYIQEIDAKFADNASLMDIRESLVLAQQEMDLAFPVAAEEAVEISDAQISGQLDMFALIAAAKDALFTAGEAADKALKQLSYKHSSKLNQLEIDLNSSVRTLARTSINNDYEFQALLDFRDAAKGFQNSFSDLAMAILHTQEDQRVHNAPASQDLNYRVHSNRDMEVFEDTLLKIASAMDQYHEIAAITEAQENQIRTDNVQTVANIIEANGMDADSSLETATTWFEKLGLTSAQSYQFNRVLDFVATQSQEDGIANNARILNALKEAIQEKDAKKLTPMFKDEALDAINDSEQLSNYLSRTEPLTLAAIFAVGQKIIAETQLLEVTEPEMEPLVEETLAQEPAPAFRLEPHKVPALVTDLKKKLSDAAHLHADTAWAEQNLREALKTSYGFLMRASHRAQQYGFEGAEDLYNTLESTGQALHNLINECQVADPADPVAFAKARRNLANAATNISDEIYKKVSVLTDSLNQAVAEDLQESGHPDSDAIAYRYELGDQATSLTQGFTALSQAQNSLTNYMYAHAMNPSAFHAMFEQLAPHFLEQQRQRNFRANANALNDDAMEQMLMEDLAKRPDSLQLIEGIRFGLDANEHWQFPGTQKKSAKKKVRALLDAYADKYTLDSTLVADLQEYEETLQDHQSAMTEAEAAQAKTNLQAIEKHLARYPLIETNMLAALNSLSSIGARKILSAQPAVQPQPELQAEPVAVESVPAAEPVLATEQVEPIEPARNPEPYEEPVSVTGARLIFGEDPQLTQAAQEQSEEFNEKFDALADRFIAYQAMRSSMLSDAEAQNVRIRLKNDLANHPEALDAMDGIRACIESDKRPWFALTFRKTAKQARAFAHAYAGHTDMKRELDNHAQTVEMHDNLTHPDRISEMKDTLRRIENRIEALSSDVSTRLESTKPLLAYMASVGYDKNQPAFSEDVPAEPALIDGGPAEPRRQNAFDYLRERFGGLQGAPQPEPAFAYAGAPNLSPDDILARVLGGKMPRMSEESSPLSDKALPFTSGRKEAQFPLPLLADDSKAVEDTVQLFADIAEISEGGVLPALAWSAQQDEPFAKYLVNNRFNPATVSGNFHAHKHAAEISYAAGDESKYQAARYKVFQLIEGLNGLWEKSPFATRIRSNEEKIDQLVNFMGQPQGHAEEIAVGDKIGNLVAGFQEGKKSKWGATLAAALKTGWPKIAMGASVGVVVTAALLTGGWTLTALGLSGAVIKGLGVGSFVGRMNHEYDDLTAMGATRGEAAKEAFKKAFKALGSFQEDGHWQTTWKATGRLASLVTESYKAVREAESDRNLNLGFMKRGAAILGAMNIIDARTAKLGLATLFGGVGGAIAFGASTAVAATFADTPSTSKSTTPPVADKPAATTNQKPTTTAQNTQRPSGNAQTPVRPNVGEFENKPYTVLPIRQNPAYGPTDLPAANIPHVAGNIPGLGSNFWQGAAPVAPWSPTDWVKSAQMGPAPGQANWPSAGPAPMMQSPTPGSSAWEKVPAPRTPAVVPPIQVQTGTTPSTQPSVTTTETVQKPRVATRPAAAPVAERQTTGARPRASQTVVENRPERSRQRVRPARVAVPATNELPAPRTNALANAPAGAWQDSNGKIMYVGSDNMMRQWTAGSSVDNPFTAIAGAVKGIGDKIADTTRMAFGAVSEPTRGLGVQAEILPPPPGSMAERVNDVMGPRIRGQMSARDFSILVSELNQGKPHAIASLQGLARTMLQQGNLTGGERTVLAQLNRMSTGYVPPRPRR